MRLKVSLWFIVYSLLLNPIPCSAETQDKFVYDSMDRRDPFIPLLDKDSPTGLRTVFVPPGEDVELPLELEVEGILWNGQEYFAVINEKILKTGQRLGQVTIAEITKDRIIIEYADKRFPVYLRKEKAK